MEQKKIHNEDIEHLSFEKALKELEDIVVKMERGDIALEESIIIYERGEALKNRCETLLKAAEEKIEKIKLNSEGQIEGIKAYSVTEDV